MAGQHHERPGRDPIRLVARFEKGVGFGQSPAGVPVADGVHQRKDVLLHGVLADGGGIGAGDYAAGLQRKQRLFPAR